MTSDAYPTALITGASAGLGAEFARRLAARDYNLVLVARRQDKLEQLAATLRASHPAIDIRCIPADLSDPEAPWHIYDKLCGGEHPVHVDMLINNAGAGGPDLFGETAWQNQAEYLELMMLSVTQMCHWFVPPMRERGHGRVINVASVAGRMSRSGDCHYGPSKAYLIALSEAMHLTLVNHGIHVCALCPGFTHTEFHAEGELALMKASTPGFLWYDAPVVVAEGLKAVEAGRPVMVSGRLYRWLDPLLRSRLARWVAARFTPDR